MQGKGRAPGKGRRSGRWRAACALCISGLLFFVQHSLIHWIICAESGGKVFTEYYIFFVKFGMNEEGRGKFDFAEQG